MVNHPRRSRTTASVSPKHDHDADYAALLTAVKVTFARASRSPLFATDADLYGDYLRHLGTERAVHSCSACRRFIQAFGGLVTIADDGHAASAFWDIDAVPAFYQKAATAMVKAVSRARVVGPFLSSEKTWGLPKTGVWTHFAVSAPSIHKHLLLTAGQAMAGKREDFNTVSRALADFTPQMIAEAVRLLETGHLARSEKFIAPLHWLAELHAKRGETKDARVRANLLWRAIATAPDGYCHPRSAVTGTLLEDIAAGLPFADVKARFDAKVAPLQYQRPQAAPSAGNLAQAEAIFEKMGLAPSLERRFARLDEVQTAWAPFTPTKRATPRGGVFSHLAPKGSGGQVQASGTPEVVMTWEKFTRTVLPAAEAIDAYVSGAMNFIALTTAVHEDAPPVLKWDKPDERNPVAWYVYHNGSAASSWGLSAGWTKVNAIVPAPPMWGSNPQPHLGDGFVLVLDGCADQRAGQGNALFPECLLGELHAIRATIEAYSRRAEMQGREEASACGLHVGKKQIGYRLRVTVDGLQTDYRIDRWD